MDLLGPPPTRLPAARAANAVFALLQFRRLVIRGELPPPLFRGTLPTCSAQYERLFNTSRLPGEKRDRLWHGGGGGHVAALYGGRLFRVPVMRGGRPLRPRELQSQFQKVLEEGGPPLDPQEALGVLTAGERPPWARVRAALGRGRALRAMDEAPFIVAFDPPGVPPEPEEPPGDGHLEAEARALLHGPWHNRWFDKSFTLIVFSSGRLGVNAEQSWGDPPVLGHLWEYTLATEALELRYESSGDCRGGEEPGIPPPQCLDWEIPPESRRALSGALETAQVLSDDLELHVFTFVPPPGSPQISDALVQLALQLALVRERGPCLSYEPVPTRLFQEGRTEGVRGCGPPILALVAAMGDPETRAGRRRALLRAALRHQRAQLRAALTGAGLERHLQALEATAAARGQRDPFLQEVLGHPWALASSPAPRADPPLLPPSLHLAGGGFGPPHRDAYGVSFARGGDSAIIFHISCSATSACTDARGFAGKIRTALGELGELGWGEE
ncbi:carnitine O-palmitoyltransferase 1, muscle isoform-like [Cuculus canorus]|uniref:carnitine O-palmitoyltransferase 1, muscle isoform-like n=1 Tax=Cuculus canorus TaxID=55661 RepID=UPI0023AAC91B|nr:carnitine O-palmitoyltransferase 1, muscle isoform-like [Cuculus canorus]